MGKSLWKISKGLPAPPDLLRIRSEVVRVTHHLREGKSGCTRWPAGARHSTSQNVHIAKSSFFADDAGDRIV
ncbi:MAG: hypothetical protein DMG13_22455 [Acidobacteria bacterium]|nr:MAG: hypothetical protein DMG13_22455 [Acidobacteriota bacterium]